MSLAACFCFLYDIGSVQAANMQRLSFNLLQFLDKICLATFEGILLDAVRLQVLYMTEGCHVLKQVHKYRKLGSDVPGRFRNDIKSACLMAYLKVFEQLAATQTKSRKALQAVAEAEEHAEDYQRLQEIDFCSVDPFQVPEDMAQGIVFTVKDMEGHANASLDRLSNVTHDKHLEASSWKDGLKPDASFKDVQIYVTTQLDDDQTDLEPTLKGLQEASCVCIPFLRADGGNL